MSFLDRFKRKPSAAPDHFTVPEGHSVRDHRVTPDAGFSGWTHFVTPGGVMVVDLGIGGDETPETLPALFDRVETEFRSYSREVFLSLHQGQLRELMAPNDVRVQPARRLVVWIVRRDSLAGWIEEPQLLQTLLRRMHLLRADGGGAVYLAADCNLPRSIVDLFRGLGLGVRTASPQETFLFEVTRPEGKVLVVLAGQEPPGREGVDPFAMGINEEKDRALKDEPRLQKLMEQERAYLETRVAPKDTKPPYHAPRLRRFLNITARDGTPAARRALYEELLARQVPLLVPMDPQTRGLAVRRWPQGEALAAYPDRVFLQWTLEDTGVKTAPGIALMSVVELCQTAAQGPIAIAISIYLDRQKPEYILISADHVRELAEGKLPARL